ncbi:MAG: hypothetical protein QOH06_1202 [Acidobacteriota bacterium]|jgi:hypothetical protein|nr:hypothetical protein [Acidobacteriota bacterium]
MFNPLGFASSAVLDEKAANSCSCTCGCTGVVSVTVRVAIEVAVDMS